MRFNMGDNTKQVRVDNWGIFFLQRLQLFFSKTDYCDMTLQFEGNVQLKVHKLVMNACTDYFQVLEETCTVDENTIMMPPDLQADVIVPIVNFMYTGMLEFQLNLFDKLYKTAQIMNITILMKLLDAQKLPTMQQKAAKRRNLETFMNSPAVKKKPPVELPAPLPGRKLPIWKRKSIPTPTQSPRSSHPNDSLTFADNTPKPTRFEWPDDDLPQLNPMDSTFEDISYTSKPLLTKEEELRARNTNFDDLRSTANTEKLTMSAKKATPSIDMEEITDYVKEQKIRVGMNEEGDEKKRTEIKTKQVVKKVKFDEGTKSPTISIATEGKSGELDHEKIVAEILKKYPQLVKKNKNIKLKIMANKKVEPVKKKTTEKNDVKHSENKPPWICQLCSSEDEPLEFPVYYLYRKHMTETHNEKPDPKRCRYCGQRYNKQHLLMYHLHIKHGMKAGSGFKFPKCDQCPFIALGPNALNKHKLRHDKNEMQCLDCKLAFTNQATLNCHIQITGHSGKNQKTNYDCQYCTKKLQTSTNLFSHLRSLHRNEAIRDGIVSIDDDEDYEDETYSKDEYILPEIISEEPAKKVTILSDVKVQERQHPEVSSLEPSSEAEALNNVATGIATSLGLVDIVVLNENQQIFQTEQSEFILPEFTHQSQNEVTDGVITQSMLSSDDIGSTDELVMVLTDHDYGDNQEDVHNDNSNIVVLYSHPVEGQQEQYITSDGNLMVNSQGLLEIRNGADEAQDESIELIQREIESHQETKTEIEEEKKQVELPEKKDLIESLTQGEQLELTSPLLPVTENQEAVEQVNEEVPPEPESVPMEVQQVTETVPNEETVQTEEQPEIETTPTEDVAETTPKEEETEQAISQEEVIKEEEIEPPEVAPTTDDHSMEIEPPEEEKTIDENSQSSQGSQKEESNQSTKIAILDDWEDTDSQQSGEQKDRAKEVAGQTVDKLMDDWEEEEEEESKK